MIVMDVKLLFSSESHNPSNLEMIRQYVRGQKEKYLGYMCGYFYFIKGSCGIITKNIDISNGIANGTQSDMIDIILKP